MSDARPQMPRSESIFVGMCAGTIAFVIALVAPLFSSQPVYWYYPLEHRWAFEVKPHGLAMDFYGRLVLGLGVGSVAAIVAIAIATRFRRLGGRLRGLLIAWTATAVLLAIAYLAWMPGHHAPRPEPLPSWYSPR